MDVHRFTLTYCDISDNQNQQKKKKNSEMANYWTIIFLNWFSLETGCETKLSVFVCFLQYGTIEIIIQTNKKTKHSDAQQQNFVSGEV